MYWSRNVVEIMLGLARLFADFTDKSTFVYVESWGQEKCDNLCTNRDFFWSTLGMRTEAWY